MVETGQFATKSKGDRVMALKRQKKTLRQDSPREVTLKITTRCDCDRLNGNFSNTSRTQIHRLLHNFSGNFGKVKFYVEFYQSDYLPF